MLKKSQRDELAVKRSIKDRMAKSKTKKSRAIKTAVVKDGVRKARSIRKFQDSYMFGMAYVGLMELQQYEIDDGATSGSYTITRRKFKATKDVDTAWGTVRAYAYMTIEQRRYDMDYGKRRAEYAWAGDYEGIPQENIDLWEYNMSDIMQVIVSGRIGFFVKSEMGGEVDVPDWRGEGYQSVEDCLDAMTIASEQLWGDLTITMRDYVEELAEYNSQKVQFPDTINVPLPNGKTIVMSMTDRYGSKRDGHWTGQFNYVDDASGIEISFISTVLAIAVDDNGNYSDDFSWRNDRRSYQIDRSSNIAYYDVSCMGTITDQNTQVNTNIKDESQFDEWSRSFGGEGADTIEGAVAIIQSNFAEVYQEWQDYIASAREYEKVGHGTGYRRTVENVNEWNYNYGDSDEDYAYERFQNNMEERDAWDTDNGVFEFRREYMGEYGTILDYDRESYDSSIFVFKPYSEDGDYAKFIMENGSREKVEQACNALGWYLVEYQDPTHFKVQVRQNIHLSAKKSRKMRKSKPVHLYYDIEVMKMMKSKNAIKASKMKKNASDEFTSKMLSVCDIFYGMTAKDQKALNDAISDITRYDSFTSFIDDLLNEFRLYADTDGDDGHIAESARKSKFAKMNRALNKLGGFTKEDEEEDEDVEIDIDVKGDDVDEEDEELLDETVQEVEGKPEDDSIEERCKSHKAMRTSKRRKMRKEGVNLPEDADDQQDINEKGSGNAGSELPEDADDVKEVNDAGSGSAGDDLPEDADDAEDQKQAFRKRSRKDVSKFSVTAGGSPDQTSYIDRYNQAPRMREAIDRHFIPGKTDVDMLQDRIDEMAKSRRNSTGNNILTKLKRR